MDIAAWAIKRNLPVIELYPPVIEEVLPHIVGDKMAQEEFAFHRPVLERPQTLIAIENAFLRDRSGLVELPDGQICYEGNWWLPYVEGHPSYRRRLFLKRRQLTGDWYSLLCLWSSEYYHWFHDVLPRLETALPHLPAGVRFLINEEPNEYQLESLTAYGISADKLELQPTGFRTRVERLWFATPVGHTSMGSPEVICRVARRLKSYFSVDQTDAQLRRIYISRQKAASRRVVNEAELCPRLEEQGFQVAVLEDMSWREQVRFFSAAEAIMGPHGAGLMNMMFATKDSTVWEISAHSKTVPCYLILARQMGFQFHRLQALPEGDETKGDMCLPPESI